MTVLVRAFVSVEDGGEGRDEERRCINEALRRARSWAEGCVSATDEVSAGVGGTENTSVQHRPEKAVCLCCWCWRHGCRINQLAEPPPKCAWPTYPVRGTTFFRRTPRFCAPSRQPVPAVTMFRAAATRSLTRAVLLPAQILARPRYVLVQLLFPEKRMLTILQHTTRIRPLLQLLHLNPSPKEIPESRKRRPP